MDTKGDATSPTDDALNSRFATLHRPAHGLGPKGRGRRRLHPGQLRQTGRACQGAVDHEPSLPRACGVAVSTDGSHAYAQFKWQHRLGQTTAELSDASCKFKNGKDGDMESKGVCMAKPGCMWDLKQPGEHCAAAAVFPILNVIRRRHC